MQTNDYPLVSVVTPSLNMAPFLEDTIRSVLSQDYPRLEYIVMDGGSTDGTLNILRKYEGRLRHESQPDRGQADAINRGFLQSSGRIFAYLNADDTYLPGAVTAAVRHLVANPGYAGVYGEAYHVNGDGKILGRYETRPFDARLLRTQCFICQPAVFLWREAFEKTGMLDPGLDFAMDYDLWIRIAKRQRLLKVDDYLAASRMHRGNKTLGQRTAVYRELAKVVRRHYGYVPFPYIYAYACSLVDKRDGFFEPVPPSLLKYLLSLGFGTCRNVRHLPRFLKEWCEAGLDAWRRGAWPQRGRRR